MADHDHREPIIPYSDNYDNGQSTDDLNFLILDEHANPSLIDLLSTDDTGQPIISNNSHNSASLPPSDHQYVTQDHVSDTNINFLFDQNTDSWIVDEPTFDGAGNTSNHQAGPSGVRVDQEINNDDHQQVLQQENVELPGQNDLTARENTTSISTGLVLQQVLFNCDSCQVLREISHVNEHNDHFKLQIHGTLGLICHAILEKTNPYVENSTSYQKFDFNGKGTEDVKQFLREYCLERSQEGYMMINMNDPLAIFYEALSVGLEWHDLQINNYGDFVQNPAVNSNSVEENRMEQPLEQQGQLEAQQQEGLNQSAAQNEEQRNGRKFSLAEQRQRTIKMTLQDLRHVFHLPIVEAAKCVEVCPTVVKKICRRYNLKRWPFRKVKSIKGKIEKLKPSLDSSVAETRDCAEAEINRLREQAATACAGISIL